MYLRMQLGRGVTGEGDEFAIGLQCQCMILMVIGEVGIHTGSLFTILAILAFRHILQVSACLIVVVLLVLDTAKIVAGIDDVGAIGKLTKILGEAFGRFLVIATCIGQLSRLVCEGIALGNVNGYHALGL